MKKSSIIIGCILISFTIILLFIKENKESYQTSPDSAKMQAEETSQEEKAVENTVENKTTVPTDKEEITDSINAAIQINKSRIENYLKNFPTEIKWIDIGLFDFTNDGKEEIILSYSYAASAGGPVILYNYVYDRQGKELFAFLSGSSTSIYADYNTMEFYICSLGIHWSAHSNMDLYMKIVKRERWEKDFFTATWDMRSSLDNDDKYNYIFRVPISHEESLFCNMREKWLEICHNPQYKQSEEELAAYLHSYENLQEYQIQTRGGIVCSDDKIVVKIGEEQTELLPNTLPFEWNEDILCIYEGLTDLSQYPETGVAAGICDKYALYRETAENDI